MSVAAEILRIIEVADPEDSEKLDEIDARVWCWLYQPTINWESVELGGDYNYCKSRDALKAIRPDGWIWEIDCFPHGHIMKMRRMQKVVTSKQLPTEELAELHAIIQTIEYERSALKEKMG